MNVVVALLDCKTPPLKLKTPVPHMLWGLKPKGLTFRLTECVVSVPPLRLSVPRPALLLVLPL